MATSQDGTPCAHPASRLFSQVLEVNHALERALCRCLNTNETDFQALQHLIRAQDLTPGGLADRLQISTAATTAVIDRMAERGHVERRAHPSDRRSQLISPSPTAVRAILNALGPLSDDAGRIIDGFGERDQAAVVRYLEAMLEALNSRIDTFHTTEDPTNRSRRS